MLLITVTVLFILAEKSNGGYIHRPITSFKLPKIESNFHVDKQKNVKEFLPQPTIENLSPHSVQSPRDYEEQQHYTLLSDSIHKTKVIDDLTIPYKSNLPNDLENAPVHHYKIPAINIPSLELIAPINNQERNAATNTEQYFRIPANIPINQNNDLVGSVYSHVNDLTIPAVKALHSIQEQSNFVPSAVQDNNYITANSIPNINFLESTKIHSNSEASDIHNGAIPSINLPSVNTPALPQLQSDSMFTTEEHIVEEEDNSNLNSPINLQDAVPPKIVKHIYFHAPPPEVEEPPIHAVPKKIKNVNIIFIKVPSQESKGIAQLLVDTINQVAPVEEKTIIYVLSKRPMTQEAYLRKPVASPHEVFFVKYNGRLDTAVTKISGNLEQIYS